MNERSSITTTEKPSSSRQGASEAASGSVAKAARRGNIKPVSAEERDRMIAMAAYYRAEQRGFAPGHELEDWCEAETEIERQLRHD